MPRSSSSSGSRRFCACGDWKAISGHRGQHSRPARDRHDCIRSRHSAGHNHGWALTTDARQRVVVAGRSAHYRGNTSQYDYWLALARLTPQGQLDPTFADGGAYETMLQVDQPDNPRDIVYDNPGSVGLDRQGRIIVPGSVLAPVSDAVVFRTLPGGDADAGFGDDGLLRLHMPSGSGGAALPLDDGSMLVTGGNWVDTFTTGIFLERVLQDGALDPRFGVEGIGEIPLPEGMGGGALITPTGDGGWLVAGPISTGASDIDGLGVAVAKFDANGIPDADFASNGLAMIGLPDGRFLTAVGMALQPDGRLLAAGSIGEGPGQVPHFAVIRIVIDAGITHRD
ncbi:MAG: hypothetical protein U1F23_09435 [Lysobacterales bacterium]